MLKQIARNTHPLERLKAAGWVCRPMSYSFHLPTLSGRELTCVYVQRKCQPSWSAHMSTWTTYPSIMLLCLGCDAGALQGWTLGQGVFRAVFLYQRRLNVDPPPCRCPAIKDSLTGGATSLPTAPRSKWPSRQVVQSFLRELGNGPFDQFPDPSLCQPEPNVIPS